MRDNQPLLVTGATGFLGREIVRQCTEQGRVVRTIGRSPQANLPNYHSVNLAVDNCPRKIFESIGTVIHAAGLAHQFGKAADDRDHFFQVNSDATEKLIRLSAENGVEHFVLVSSSGVYGPSDEPRDEATPCHPVGHYAESKLAGETRAIAVAKQTGIRLTILRMTTLYGNGDRGNMDRLIKAIKQGRFIQIGKCSNRKNFIHKSDAARACLLAATSKSPDHIAPADPTSGNMPEIYNVGVPSVSMQEVLNGIIEALKCKPPRYIPSSIALGVVKLASLLCIGKGPFPRLKKSIEKWLSNDEFDTQKFQYEFDFQPSISLKEGLATQVDAINQSLDVPTFPIPLSSGPKNNRSKRIFDLSLGLLLVVMFSLPMLLVAILVKLTSKGPALYWSNRVGMDNKLFPMAKFRTMRTETPEVATHLLGDSKSWITPLGRVLRKTSLDELPQLFNILAGHMSFVGPRPALHNQDDLIELRSILGVHRVRPGITGLAQVSGRDELLICEKVEFDRQYLSRQNFWFDLRMIFQTAFAVVAKKGVKQADEDSDIPFVILREGNDTCIISTPETVSATAVAIAKWKEIRLVCLRTETRPTATTMESVIADCPNVHAFIRSGEFSDDNDREFLNKIVANRKVTITHLEPCDSDMLGHRIESDYEQIQDSLNSMALAPVSNKSSDPPKLQSSTH